VILAQDTDAELRCPSVASVVFGDIEQRSSDPATAKSLTDDQLGDERVVAGWLIERFERDPGEYEDETDNLSSQFGHEQRPGTCTGVFVHLREVGVRHGLSGTKAGIDPALRILQFDDTGATGGGVTGLISPNCCDRIVGHDRWLRGKWVRR
jgi:hypothetical protein